MYLPHWRLTEDPAAKLAVFCTRPAIRSTSANFLTEVIGTAMLLFGVLAIGANAEGWAQAGDVDLSQVFSRALQPLLVGILVLGIGLSLGGPTGYAINPARDLGPRIAHAILPFPARAPRTGHTPGSRSSRRSSAESPAPRSTPSSDSRSHMPRYVGALDQGTTSTRFMVFDAAGAEVARRQIEHTQIMPKPGWVEHDPVEIAARTNEVITGALRAADLDGKDLAAIGVTNQRETTVVWNPKTGRPWYNAIVWQDTRTDRIVSALEPKRQLLYERTGLPPATYFSGTKLQWILENVDGVRAAAERGEAVFGNIDTWVIWNLTGGADGGVHVTDVTNASRTLLMDLRTLDWDDELLALFGIPRRMLPAIKSSSDTAGLRRDASKWSGGRRSAGVRRSGRSAGRDRRPGMFLSRRGEEHLRNRQLHASQHRARRRRLRRRACSRRSATSSAMRRRCTRSKDLLPSPVLQCSGCAISSG